MILKQKYEWCLVYASSLIIELLVVSRSHHPF